MRAAGPRIKYEPEVVYDPVETKWRLLHDMDINYITAVCRPE
ncbi:MAG: hypothetical protein ACREDA_10040 [Methylocella sp.]